MRFPFGWPQSLGSALLALFLALLIWVAATNIGLDQRTIPPEGSNGLPITLVNLAPGLVVTEGADATVHVELRIPTENSERLRAGDLVAEVDLTGLGPGIHPVPVTVRARASAPSFRLVRPDPDMVQVHLDEVVTRTLAVEPAIGDLSSLPQTFQVLTMTVAPPTVTLTGPRAQVEPIQQVVAEARLDGAREPLIRVVEPRLLGPSGSLPQEAVLLSTEQFTVTAEIALRPGYRNLVVSTPIQGEPAEGFWIRDVRPTPQLVTVTGEPETLAALDSIVNTEPIQVEALREGTITRSVRLQLPEGVAPLADTSVQVTVIIAPQTSSKRVTVRPTITGLQLGQEVRVGDIAPAAITVLLTGPVTELEALSLDDVIATLDVAGLATGTHLIPPRIQPPGALRADSVSPEVVEVTLRETQVERPLALSLQPVGLVPGTVVTLAPATLSVTVAGPTSAVERLLATETTLLVEVGGQGPGNYTITPTLALTAPLTLTTPIPSVQVTVYPEADVLTLGVSVTLRGLTEGLGAAALPTVRLRVAGPGSTASLRTNAEFIVEVDVTGRGAGTHTLRPIVRLPAGYSLVDMTPPTVTLRLSAAR